MSHAGHKGLSPFWLALLALSRLSLCCPNPLSFPVLSVRTPSAPFLLALSHLRCPSSRSC